MPKAQEPLPPTAHRGLSLRTWVALLVLATIIPLGLFGWITLHSMAQSQADASLKNQQETARVLASAVDAELHAWKATVAALAQSQALQRGDFAEFHKEATAVAAQQDGWINLVDPAGRQVLNSLRPNGTSLPNTAARALLHTILTEGRVAVSDLVFGSLTQRWAVPVAAPVVRDGKVAYMLELIFAPDKVTALLKRQQLPASWTLAIQDSQYRNVTRLPLTEERIGKPAPSWYVAALRSADHGVATGATVQGIPARLVFNHLTEAPWTVSLAIPLADLPSPRPVYWFIVLGALLGCCVVAVALYAGRKLTAPVTALAENAEKVLRGEVAGLTPSGSREVQHLQEALVVAADRVRALHEAEARAVVAEELRAGEALLRAVTDNSPDAIYVKDLQSRWLMANPAVLRIVGKTAAEALGKTDLELYADPQIGRAILENDRRIIERGHPEAFEEVADTPEGRRTFLSIKAPRRDPKGAIIGLIGISHDITARKQAEAALREANARFEEATAQAEDANIQLEESNAQLEQEVLDRKAAETALAAANVALAENEARYRGLVELSPDAVLVHRDWQIVYANAAAVHLYGAASADQLCGKHILDLVHPADRNIVWERVHQEQTGCTTPNRELRHRRLDGQDVPVETTAAPIEWQGKPAVQVIVRDITERKRADAKLRETTRRFQTIVDHAPLAIYVKNRDGRFVFGNRQLERFTGHPLERLLGMTDYDFAPKEDADRWRENDLKVLEGQRAEFEETGIDRDGRPYVNISVKFPLSDESGTPVEVCGISTDITARKQAGEALQRAHAELEQRVQERTAELSQAVRQLEQRSGQLRTLASELTLAEQRERERLAMRLHDDLQQLLVGMKLVLGPLAQAEEPKVREVGREVNALLMQTLACSRSLTEDLSPPILHRSGLVPALRWLGEWMAEKHQLVVAFRADEPILIEPHEHAVLLFRAIRELLFNAAKHAQVQTATVEIAQQDNLVRARVSDDGVGFDPRQLRWREASPGASASSTSVSGWSTLEEGWRWRAPPRRVAASRFGSRSPRQRGRLRLPLPSPPLRLRYLCPRWRPEPGRSASSWWTIIASCARAWSGCSQASQISKWWGKQQTARRLPS